MDVEFEKRKKEVFEIIRKLLQKGNKHNRNTIISKTVSDDDYDFLEDIKDSEGRRTSLFLVKDKLKFAIDMTKKYLGIEPTVDDIMYMTELDRNKIEEYFTYRRVEESASYEEEIEEDEIINSLEDGDEATIDGGGYVISDGIYAETEDYKSRDMGSVVIGSQIENDIYYKELKKMLNKILATLDPREKKILVLRFGLNGEVVRTQEEVAKILSISQVRVRQIENRALRKLAEPNRRKYVESFLDNPDDDGR